jgi:hypothetical protein
MDEDELRFKISELRKGESCFDEADGHGLVPVTKHGEVIGFIVGLESGRQIQAEQPSDDQACSRDCSSDCTRSSWAWAENAQLHHELRVLQLEYQLLWNKFVGGSSRYGEISTPIYDAAHHVLSFRDGGKSTRSHWTSAP